MFILPEARNCIRPNVHSHRGLLSNSKGLISLWVPQILQADILLRGLFAADSKISVTAESQAWTGHKATSLDMCSTDDISRNCWNISIAKHSGPNSHSCTQASKLHAVSLTKIFDSVHVQNYLYCICWILPFWNSLFYYCIKQAKCLKSDSRGGDWESVKSLK